MIKKILILSSLLLSINSNAQTMVGGWYPMFFNTFNKSSQSEAFYKPHPLGWGN